MRCNVFNCRNKAVWHFVTAGKKFIKCRCHYCDKDYPSMKYNFSLRGRWYNTESCEEAIKKFRS